MSYDIRSAVADRLSAHVRGGTAGDLRDAMKDAIAELHTQARTVESISRECGRLRDTVEAQRDEMDWQLQWSKPAPDPRACVQCCAPLDRRPDESRARYSRRKHCSAACAAVTRSEQSRAHQEAMRTPSARRSPNCAVPGLGTPRSRGCCG